jgi:hypothetical protein
VLVRETTPVGRAYAVLRLRVGSGHNAAHYWQLSDLVSVHAPHRRLPPQRSDRPGSQLLHRVRRASECAGFGVRLTAANRTLAAKVYAPAGYVFDSPTDAAAVRPKMHLQQC